MTKCPRNTAISKAPLSCYWQNHLLHFSSDVVSIPPGCNRPTHDSIQTTDIDTVACIHTQTLIVVLGECKNHRVVAHI